MDTQNKDIEQLFKQNAEIMSNIKHEEDKIDNLVQRLTSRLDDIQNNINIIKIDIESSKVKHDSMVDSCKLHVQQLLTHEEEVKEIKLSVAKIISDINNNFKEHEVLNTRINNVKEDLEKLDENMNTVLQSISSGKSTLKVLEKIIMFIVGGAGLILTIQQIFFGNWHF